MYVYKHIWCQHNGDYLELCRLRLARLNEEMREDNEVIQGEHEMLSYGWFSLQQSRSRNQKHGQERFDVLQFKPTESEAELEE